MKLKTPKVDDVKNKTVIVRVDYNLPIKKNSNGKWIITDDKRILSSLNTINFLLKDNAKVILISHLGKPKNFADSKFSLRPIAEYIKNKLKLPIIFSPMVEKENYFQSVQKDVFLAKNSEIVLLDNLRFFPEEQENDSKFAQKLASFADVYINEAFSTSHRAHASVEAITKFLPSFAGFAFEKEVLTLINMIEKPTNPFVIVLGGAKISDKVGGIENLAQIADVILIGGAVANNFLKAQGIEIYKSYIEDESADLKKQNTNYVDIAENLIDEHKNERVLLDGYLPLPKIIYPIDMVAGFSLYQNSKTQTQIVDLTTNQLLNKNLLYLDIGPKTIKLYQKIISEARTVFWNGPMGVWENPLFAKGSYEIAKSITKRDQKNHTIIIGGGDTIACADHFNLEDKFSYVSAAGGAALDLLSGKKLPGIIPLLT